jgi:hypothetical protein
LQLGIYEQHFFKVCQRAFLLSSPKNAVCSARN